MNEEMLDVQLDADVHCPECGADMDPDDTACPQCGAEFGFFCPVCDEELPADATICSFCGAELDEGFEDDVEGSGEEDGSDVERAVFCGNCGEAIGVEDEECPSCGVDLCPDCGSPLEPEADVCSICGAEFAFSCPNCDKDLPADAKVCPHCGYEFGDEEGDEEDD